MYPFNHRMYISLHGLNWVSSQLPRLEANPPHPANLDPIANIIGDGAIFQKASCDLVNFHECSLFLFVKGGHETDRSMSLSRCCIPARIQFFFLFSETWKIKTEEKYSWNNGCYLFYFNIVFCIFRFVPRILKDPSGLFDR